MTNLTDAELSDLEAKAKAATLVNSTPMGQVLPDGTHVCKCGFVYPRELQQGWTQTQCKGVADHQQFHCPSPQPLAASPATVLRLIAEIQEGRK